MSDFKPFGKIISENFARMQSDSTELYEVDIDRDMLWNMYLGSFPEGSNPIYRERTVHDCSCCRHFIKNIAAVVALDDGKTTTIWDNTDGIGEPYRTVARTMRDAVLQKQIVSVFRKTHPEYSSEVSHEIIDGEAITYDHFHAELTNKYANGYADRQRGDANTNAAMLDRALRDIDVETVRTVQGLIADNMLYRGEEHSKALDSFLLLQRTYSKTSNPETFKWRFADHPGARIRNTVIGTLLVDLAGGRELEASVKSFEQKVAPANYKRPKSLITPRMIDDALKSIKELDIEPALVRRHARLSDLTLNNVIFADDEARSQMKGGSGLRDILMSQTQPQTMDFDKVQPTPIEIFMREIVPNMKTMDVLVENKQVPRFVSVTASKNKSDKLLFQWPNNFAWSYNGEMADSDIERRVKAAGGKVDGIMRVSLSWFNHDDLDIHVYLPVNRHIYYGNRVENGATLDVDMNVSTPVRGAVENVVWSGQPYEGKYTVQVNNFTRRENSDTGYDIEFVYNGEKHSFHSSSSPEGNKTHTAFQFELQNGNLTNLVVGKNLTHDSSPQEVWGITTKTPVRVSNIMFSPNHWDGCSTGNKHWFFILDGCINPSPTRGIYNEFLSHALTKHRKVFEIIAERTRVPYADNQLSGIGFSSTQRDTLKAQVTMLDGSKRPVVIQF